MNALLLIGVGVAVVLGSILWLRLHAFLALVLGAYCVALLTPAEALRAHAERRQTKGEITTKAAANFHEKPAAARVAEEFGRTCANLGILIAMAAILGEAMLRSGAAESIANALLRWLGAARAHWAFFSASFVLCIPVMLDTVFYLLAPLTKAVARRTNRNYLLLVLSTVAGGTITHSLVPPTPGPLFVAGALHVPLGLMIGMGTAIGLGAALAGVALATWLNRRHLLDVPLDAESEQSADAAAIAAVAEPRRIPPLWLALVPVVLPIFLIALESTVQGRLEPGSWSRWIIRTIGDKDMALTLGALAALLTLAWSKSSRASLEMPQTTPRASVVKAVQEALTSGAMIVLIIAAGGAFGGVLQQTGIAQVLGAMLVGAHFFSLPAVFLITTLVRTAQGSATVAMITAAPIANALIDSGSVHYHPVYLALAIGCGSKPFPWMNDAGFWIITRLSGMHESFALRTLSPMMSLQGVAGLVLTMIAAWLFPLR